jgi:hypothetical protein
MSLLTWTVSDRGDHYADFGRGRYSVARTHGRVPRFVARWSPHSQSVHSGPEHHGRADARSSQGCLRAARRAADRHALTSAAANQGAFARLPPLAPTANAFHLVLRARDAASWLRTFLLHSKN